MMIYRDNFEEVDTFESFYKNIIRRSNLVVIPYINVAVSRHPLNPGDDLMFIDKSYIVCLNGYIRDINGKFYDSPNASMNNNTKLIKLGGVDLESNQHTGIRIMCEDVFLETLPYSRIRRSFWMPAKTPNSEPNMNIDEVDLFFQHKSLPADIRSLIE